MLKLRKSVYSATKYVGGLTTDAVMKKYGLTSVVKLGSNENNYAPFPSVLSVMEKEIKRGNVYPEKNYERLRKELGSMYGLTSDWVALGHGAGNVLDTISKMFLDYGDEVIIPRQTYGLYKEICLLMGADVVECDLGEDYSIDLNVIQSLITEKTKLIWICNPNNPTGTIINKHELESFIRNIPEHVYVILDEAYIEFCKEEYRPNTIQLVKEGCQLLCVRTFSKYYGLAGQRIGYVVASPEVIEYYNTVSEPFNANRVGLAGAVEVISNAGKEAKKYSYYMVEDRRYLLEEFNKLGLPTIETHTNFLFVETPIEGLDFSEKLLSLGVIVRPCAGWGYKKHIRISIGTKQENQKLVEAIIKVMGSL